MKWTFCGFDWPPQTIRPFQTKIGVLNRRGLSFASLPTGCILFAGIHIHTFMYMNIDPTTRHLSVRRPMQKILNYYEKYNIFEIPPKYNYPGRAMKICRILPNWISYLSLFQTSCVSRRRFPVKLAQQGWSKFLAFYKCIRMSGCHLISQHQRSM